MHVQGRLERLVEAGTLLVSELSLEGVLEQTVQIAASVIGAKYAAIGVLAPDGRTIEKFLTHGMSEAERAARETLALPVYPELSESQQRHVVETLASFVAR